jgi:hypothetical protein
MIIGISFANKDMIMHLNFKLIKNNVLEYRRPIMISLLYLSNNQKMNLIEVHIKNYVIKFSFFFFY